MNGDRPGDILAYLERHDGARTKAIAKHMGWGGMTFEGIYTATMNELKRLEKAGKVRRIHTSSKGIEWGLVR